MTTAPEREASGTLHVVVTCTDRKSREVEADVRMEKMPRGSLDERLQAWRSALQDRPVEAVTARELYAGDHWQVVRSLEDTVPAGLALQVWVCSAGYGLVSMDTQLRPYAATFTPRHADSVVFPGAAYTTADWWQALATWLPTSTVSPRTLASLASSIANDPMSFMLVAISRQYAQALADDLTSAAELLPDRMALICTGANADSPSGRRKVTVLHRFSLPTDARLKLQVGGAMQSLNVRLARRALREATDEPAWYPSFARLLNRARLWADAAVDLPKYERTRQDSQDIRTWIQSKLAENPGASRTQLLRELRDANLACEQARFATLFREVVSATSSVTARPDGQSSSFETDERPLERKVRL
jgi:hypothetical protein